MYDSLIQWFGLQACTLAGDLTDMLEAGPACFSSQMWNMGILALGIVGISFAVMVIGARRRRHRDNFFQ
jgi:hypothetical protein